MDAGEAVSNLRVVAKAVSPPGFLGITNSDLAFTGNYVIQGNYNGPVIWDISNPARPQLVTAYSCPASQNDVSVYKNLMFMSSEGTASRLDCKPGGIQAPVSNERMRGVRIFDISDIKNPKLIKSVQTCRGSHTHTVLESPADKENIYIYISGSAGIRPSEELAGCNTASPESSQNTSLWRIEIIKVPVAHPEQAAVVNRADIFTGLKAPAAHGETAVDQESAKKAADAAKARGEFVASVQGQTIVVPPQITKPLLDSIAKAGGRTAVTAADSTALRAAIDGMIARMFGVGGNRATPGVSNISPNRQCHDITVFPAVGLAGGACEGHGILLDISNPAAPTRLDAVADSNFAYWHSATFNNDGTKLLFSDEWGGGGAPKCRATDPKEWGSDAIFSIVNRTLKFESYYKMSAPQTDKENCVAHNGSLIPIPGRDVMVQSWYQGGISVFDFTDSAHPVEIAFFDRGPLDAKELFLGGYWSAYWFNGAIYASEIARGLDVFKLKPSAFLSQNEITAATLAHADTFNPQQQARISWPATAVVGRAYLDQLTRSRALPADRLKSVRDGLESAERATAKSTRGRASADQLEALAAQVARDEASVSSTADRKRLRALASLMTSWAGTLR